MRIEFREIEDLEQVGDKELRRQVESHPLSTFVRIEQEGDPIGILVLDDNRQSDHVFLYRLWIKKGARRRGIGTMAVAWSEDWARRKGKQVLLRKPTPIDPAVSLDSLRVFQRVTGYSPDPKRRGVWRKEL